MKLSGAATAAISPASTMFNGRSGSSTRHAPDRARSMNERIDRGPTISAEPSEPAETRRIHAAERDQWRSSAPREKTETQRAETPPARMRTRGEDRRYEHGVSTGTGQLVRIMGRRGPEQRPGSAHMRRTAVRAIGSPSDRLAWRSGQQQHQPAPPCHRAHLLEQLAAVRRPVMAEDNPAAARQPSERVPQPFAHPLVGHEPEARERLAGTHHPRL